VFWLVLFRCFSDIPGSKLAYGRIWNSILDPLQQLLAICHLTIWYLIRNLFRTLGWARILQSKGMDGQELSWGLQFLWWLVMCFDRVTLNLKDKQPNVALPIKNRINAELFEYIDGRKHPFLFSLLNLLFLNLSKIPRSQL